MRTQVAEQAGDGDKTEGTTTPGKTDAELTETEEVTRVSVGGPAATAAPRADWEADSAVFVDEERQCEYVWANGKPGNRFYLDQPT